MPKLRPKNTATDSSPDIVWLRWCIENLIDCEKVSAVSILRHEPFSNCWNYIRGLGFV